jgi:hypothetical protein
VQLEPRRGGLPYIVIPSTYEPNQLAQFRLLLSTDDPGCRFGWLGAATRVLDGSAALPPPLAASGSELLAAPHNEVVVKALGAALSKAQEKELERMVADATAWCLANDGKPYEDPEFPATNRSLWGGGANLTGLPDATAWLRPAQLPHSGAPAVLFRPELEQAHEEVSGVLKGSAALDDGWLLAACNIVAGRKEALERVFLHPPRAATSAAGAAAGSAMRGFYVVGFYVDDPHSDDDWRLVLVDDRLPCGADGALLFARCARAEAFWAPLLEKALAKLSGGYAKIGPRSVADGLELLTGGTPRELDLANVATLDELTRGAASRLPAAELGAAGRRVKLLRETTLLWDELRTGLEASPPQLVGCACESSGGSGERLQPSEAELAAVRASGLQTDRLVYTVVGAIEYGGKKLMRLRQLDGASEWNGAYSDGSAQWSANMRQMFNYANNGADGIFWMEYADFVGAFNKLHLVRMASDLYTQMYTRSRWHGASAGGAARFLSHRHNPQWLLEINKPTTLTLALSVDHAADRADAPAGQVGWAIYVGNARPADRRRRRLLASATDVVVAEAPRAARKVAATVTLLRSATPYVVVAHTDEPGYEAAFRLSILSDDREDDGLPDFKFTPVRASTDWKTSALRGAWAGASAPGSGEGYWANPQFELSVERQSRVFVFLEPDRLVDKVRVGRRRARARARPLSHPRVVPAGGPPPAHTRARARPRPLLPAALSPASLRAAVRQAGEVRRQFPAAIGFELLKGERKFCKLHAQQPGQRLELAQASAGAEGVWLELPALAASGSEPYILVPFASALDVSRARPTPMFSSRARSRGRARLPSLRAL